MTLETADSRNIPLIGKIDVDMHRPPKPIYPHGTDETIWFRWGKDNVGFHRDPDWLKIVRTQPCMNCGAPEPSDPHHIWASSMSLKSSDLACIPLCRTCHEAFERDRGLKNKAPVMLAIFLVRFVAGIRGLDPKGKK
jgi:hypothetical protein